VPAIAGVGQHGIRDFAKNGLIEWALALPKTRLGKIMRRILRKIACNEPDSLGNISTLPIRVSWRG
jgi:acetyl-CoA synthetase